MVNVANIFSTLGNPNSLIPLAIKDTTSTAGMTVGSYITGKEEGHDRFIDEVGTEIIWLGGIPFFKWLYDKTLFKALGLDSRFDARNLKDKDVLAKIKEYSQNEDVKKEIEKVTKKENIFKKAATGRFFISTGLAVASYIGLTKFKQNYTEKKIRENLIKEYQESQANNSNKQSHNNKSPEPTFKGIGSAIESLAFSPVKNMWVLDGCITGERLKDSRSKQEFIGYAIKEASILFFMYYAGGKIQELLEFLSEKKYNKSIALDARVIEDDFLKNAFQDKSIGKSIEEFNAATTSNANLYEFLHKKPDNLIVKAAKMSDIITIDKKNNKIDVRKFIDLKETKKIKDKIEKLYNQYNDSISKGEKPEEFFNKVKKLKRMSILTNIGSCILALGVLTPGIMLLNRMTADDNKEFETKKKIREDLIKKGLIA